MADRAYLLMDFYNEPAFWKAVAAAFGFLSVVVGSIRYLARVQYLYIQKNIMVKAKFDSSIEKLRQDTILKTIEGLKETVNLIEPLIAKHEIKMGTLEIALKNIESLERQLTLQTDDLKISYENFARVIPKVTASGQLLLDRMIKIETEILKLKEGSENIYVTTKK